MAGSRRERYGRRVRAVREAAGRVLPGRRRGGPRPPERSRSLLEVHDIGSLRGPELDGYIERIRPPNVRVMLPWLAMVIAPCADVVHGRVGRS